MMKPWRADEDNGRVQLYGLHAVEAALRNPRRAVLRLCVTDNAARRLSDAIVFRRFDAERVSPRDLDKLLGADTVHQGALLEAGPLPEASLEELAQAAGVAGPIVVLDQVTDPHNAGAVLRSAAMFGAAGLVVARRHSPPLEGALAKAASGAVELLPVVLVQNLARALTTLKEQGVAVIGLDGGADDAIEREPLASRLALVLGAEGKGLRSLTRETCDRLVRISGAGPLSSLNVSNAAAVALHLAMMCRLAGADGAAHLGSEHV